MKLRKLLNVWVLVILTIVTNIVPNVYADNGTVLIMTDKQEYKIGEDSDITVEYCHTTSATDWIGIYKKGVTPGSGNPSILWKYAEISDDYKTMIFTDAIGSLTAGEYKAVLLENDGYTVKAEYPFAVKDTSTLNAPAAVTYTRTFDKEGYADGTVTITEPDDTSGISGYALYWGDDSGKLVDYDAIATLSQGVTTYTMVKNTFIPATATKLLAFSSNSTKESENYASFDIPAGWCIDQSNMTSQFEVFSDTHITTYNSSHNTRFGNALKDIYTIAPDSEAIFANGDNVDLGHPDNYAMLLSILNQYKAELPEINFIIGNHEYYENYSDMHHNINMTCKEKADQFMDQLGAPGIYYDKYINKIHFIALGSEMAEVVDGSEGTYYISDDTYLSDAQFTWLENKLAETKDQKTPIFVFHHQPMADTVAGTIGGKSGQGWNGLSDQQDARLRSILSKYPQVIMFNGHTHWDMKSPHEMYDGGKEEPSIFNTASVGYLWTDIPSQMEVVGSQGFYVETYQDKVLVRGRDFENGLWIPSASFLVDMNEKYSSIDEPASTLSAINLSTDTNLKVGETSQSVVTAVYSDNSTADVSKAAEYRSSQPTIAEVDENGFGESIKCRADGHNCGL